MKSTHRPFHCFVLAVLFLGTTISLAASDSTGPESAKNSTVLPGRQVGRVEPANLNEISGIAVSRQNPGVLWVHNDSGGAPCAYALNREGRLLGTYRLGGARNVDWEDIALGPGPLAGQDYLYLGDIGDNQARRPNITVYRVPEPRIEMTPSSRTLTLTGVATFTIFYPDGAHDSEALLVDPIDNDLLIVVKNWTANPTARVYRYPLNGQPQRPQMLELLTTIPTGSPVTGGDISPTGDQILIRTYLQAILWTRKSGQSLTAAFRSPYRLMPIHPEPQGEAIGFDREGRGYFTISEGVHQPIYYYPLAGE